MKTLEISFEDLKPESQQEVLQFYGVKTKEEMNAGLFPLFVLEIADSEEEEECDLW